MKLFPYLKQGDNAIVFKERNLETTTSSQITISKVIVYWRFENVDKDTSVKLVDKDGAVTSVAFGKGYWSFLDIKKRFGEEGIRLEGNPHNNTCRIHTGELEVNLKEIGPLLGFQQNEVIQRGLVMNSNKVNINRHLEYVTLSCNTVDSEKVVDWFGEPGEIVAVLPVDTSQRLNGTFTKFENATFSSPVTNGSHKKITFTIRDNLLLSQVKLYLTCECVIH